MKKLTQKIRLVIILLVTTFTTQSCIFGQDNITPRVTTQEIRYVIFTSRPSDENLSGPKGAYQDLDGNGLADPREGGPQPFTADKGDYQIDKVLRKAEIVLWDGNLNHPYQKTGETTTVAFPPGKSKLQVGVPIPVTQGNLLYTISKDSYDRLQKNTAGWSTYVEANL